ncbi:hypothetical protein [Shimia sp. SDUM112013]|uniref:DUF6998 domain-containing protein n=1 Tax=Shimia sp. SDUM112013 TaxID=3136160 RepID=UPI0032EF4FA4
MPVYLELPPAVAALIEAQSQLRRQYAGTNLQFTLDGKLVGDIGEAVAAQAFDLELIGGNATGVDARTSQGKSVQIKATGKPKGSAHFRPSGVTADYLIVLFLNYADRRAELIYNGPEAPVRKHLYKTPFLAQKAVSLNLLRKLQKTVAKDDQLNVRQHLLGTN